MSYTIGDGSVRYSSIRANLGGNALIQQPHGEVILYSTQGTPKWPLAHEIRTDTQPTFYDVGHVLVTDTNRILRVGIDLIPTVEEVAIFPEFATLSVDHAEGDLTSDGFLALCGVYPDSSEVVFTYNVNTGSRSKLYRHPEAIDGIKATVGGYLLVSGSSGIYVYPPVGGVYQITPKNGHACPAVYNGKPVFLWCSNARSKNWRNAVEMYDVATGSLMRALIDFGNQNYAMHISASPDSAIVSVYDPTMNLLNQMWECPFSSPDNKLIHQWSAQYRGYDSTPRATWSEGLILYNHDDGSKFRVDAIDTTVNITPPVKGPVKELPEGFFEVSMANEPNSRYLVELPIKDGKTLPWRMFKKNE